MIYSRKPHVADSKRLTVMSQTLIMRILDASLNRASEGLRVVEDYARFVLDAPFLTGEFKALRHDLADAAASVASSDLHAARDTRADVGIAISHEREGRRSVAADVCAANLKRAEQSLRSLEEYGKLIDGQFACRMESFRYRLYTLEKSIDVSRLSRERLEGVNLCVLLDGCDSEAKFDRLATALIGAGVGMIQLRDKQLDDRELVLRARRLVALTRGQPPALPGVGTRNGFSDAKAPAEPGAVGDAAGTTLAIINDRADIAAVVGADGVHLGQDDLSVKDARAIVGTRMLVGVSTHNMEQGRAAVLDGANYIGAGPTFASSTKDFEWFAGLEYLRQVSSEIRLPVFAIGGINCENLPEVLAAGIGRVAVGAAVVEAADPACAVREMLGMLNEADVKNPAAKAASPFLTSDL
jgi:thiamine-phosphate pyrophosphorylase